MPRVTFVTVVTGNYVHQLLLWARLIRAHHPQSRLRVYVVDGMPKAMQRQAQALGMEVVAAQDLEIPDWTSMLFKYEAIGVACALRPWVILDALDHRGGKVIYLDCDIGTFAPANEMLTMLDTHPLVLTPHCIVPPANDGKFPDPMNLRLVGYFNSGVMGIHGDLARPFFEWQKGVLEHECIVSVSSGILLDQAFTVQALGMVPHVGILTRPGYNTGHWNLHEQEIAQDDSGLWTSNGQPLVFFHFSGLRLSDAFQGLSVHQNRIAPGARPQLDRLCEHYLQAWREAARELGPLPDYQCLTLSDGTPILWQWREAVRLKLVSWDDGSYFSAMHRPTYQAFETHPLVTGAIYSQVDRSNRDRHLQSLAERQGLGVWRKRWGRIRRWVSERQGRVMA